MIRVGRTGNKSDKSGFCASGITLPNVQGCVQFVDISFSYPTRPKVPVLQNVNLTINSGELVAVVSIKSRERYIVKPLLEKRCNENLRIMSSFKGVLGKDGSVGSSSVDN